MNIEALLKEEFLSLDFEQEQNKRILEATGEFVLGGAYLSMLTSQSNNAGKYRGGAAFKGLLIALMGTAVTFYFWPQEYTYTPIETITLKSPQLHTETNSTIENVVLPVESIAPKGLRPMDSFYKSPTPVMADSSFPENLTKDYSNSERIVIRLANELDLPELNEAQLKAHHKQKSKMIKDLLRLNKKEYPEIEGWPKAVKEEVLYMKALEVSNIEYRTFLHDLIINRKYQEYNLAKVEDEMWLDDSLAIMEAISLTYSWHPAYDHYPVVNVSRLGAKLFCNWLLQSAKARDIKKQKIIAIRIPSRAEWEFAASGGNTKHKYPWGGPYLRNSEGCFLANYRPYKDDYAADGGLMTVGVDSYAPNQFGLYGMAGNAAEMVEYADGSVGTGGGSWSSVAEEIMIKGSDRFKGVEEPNRNIGFRPVVMVKDL